MTTATIAPQADNSPPVPRAAWAVLAVVLVAEVMDLVDGTVVNVAGPAVRGELGGSTAFLQWLGAGYTLAFAVLLITGGRLGDIFGRRRMFMVGIVGFTAASAACAAAASPEMLLVTRVLQGAFGAVLIPQGFGMIKQAFPPDQIGKAFAFFGPVIGLSAVLGPIIGGVLVDADLLGTGWRMIFLINLPLGLAGIVGALRWLPRDGQPTGGHLDLGGVAIVTGAAAALVYPLIQGRELGWPYWAFVLMAAGLVAFVLLPRYERSRSGLPLVEPALLRSRAYVGGIAVAVSFFTAMIGVSLVLSLFCQLGLGFSPLKTGLTMAPLPLGLAALAGVSFRLAPRYGRRVIQAGLLLQGAGLVLTAAIVAHTGADTGSWDLAPGILVIGLGSGLVAPPMFDVILSGIADEHVGSGSGVLNAVQQMAGAIGLAVVGTLFFAFTDHGASAPEAMWQTLLLVLVPIAIGTGLSFLLPRGAEG